MLCCGGGGERRRLRNSGREEVCLMQKSSIDIIGAFSGRTFVFPILRSAKKTRNYFSSSLRRELNTFPDSKNRIESFPRF